MDGFEHCVVCEREWESQCKGCARLFDVADATRCPCGKATPLGDIELALMGRKYKQELDAKVALQERESEKVIYYRYCLL